MTDAHYPSTRRPVDEVIRTLTIAARQGRSTSPPSWQDIDVAIRPTARAGRTWEPDEPRGAFEPRPSSCATDPHAPSCGVEVYFAHPTPATPWRSHRVPTRIEWAPLLEQALAVDRPAMLADLGRLLAAVDSGRAPCVPAPMPRYHGRPAARAAEVSPMPVVPDLLPGLDVPDLAPVDDYLPCRGEAVAWDDDCA